jgi:hypothetical protein
MRGASKRRDSGRAAAAVIASFDLDEEDASAQGFVTAWWHFKNSWDFADLSFSSFRFGQGLAGFPQSDNPPFTSFRFEQGSQ